MKEFENIEWNVDILKVEHDGPFRGDEIFFEIAMDHKRERPRRAYTPATRLVIPWTLTLVGTHSWPWTHTCE